jgi:hypothetical protein
MATETEKFAKVVESGDNQVIGEFIDWLGEHGYWVSEYVKIEGFRDEMLMPIRKSNASLLADYFGIDLAQLDREKRDLLAKIQSGGSG